MDITIYHNPTCSKSRATLALIREAGFEPLIVEYLQTPPTRVQLAELIARLDISARTLIRQTDDVFIALGLDGANIAEKSYIDAMMAHPHLMNRPIVVSPLGARLCRPPEVVYDILPA